MGRLGKGSVRLNRVIVKYRAVRVFYQVAARIFLLADGSAYLALYGLMGARGFGKDAAPFLPAKPCPAGYAEGSIVVKERFIGVAVAEDFPALIDVRMLESAVGYAENAVGVIVSESGAVALECAAGNQFDNRIGAVVQAKHAC